MKKSPVFIFVIVMAISLACNLSGQSLPTVTVTATSAEVSPAETFTPNPTFTPIPTVTPIPETIVVDFVAQLCNAKWMNGVQKFAACPEVNADQSKGYAVAIDPASEGLPVNTPVLLTIPAYNGYAALFLRYPALTVQEGDHFSATLRCQNIAAVCDVSFGLDYYDANEKYHSPLVSWNQNSGMSPTAVDYDLSALAGQNVDIVLALRPNNATPQQDASLWIAPQIYRLSK
jgi:hypothetical protein